ncbi:unnamed protein product [Triticum turgidum subsp. durum]|uniref:NADH-ubiquinone oxidoreductase chain 4L n=1 Tax=Triticum turgidum subsp. durum TaxID=4567 RepID=A0A9R1S736_TRITD|nr:unnamed protein product [Triticum turgidum subsp. durum]
MYLIACTFLSVYLFSIGIYGLITSRNMVGAIIGLELICNSINLHLVTFFDLFDSRQLKGDIFAIFVITLAAAEAAIGLSILSSIHQPIYWLIQIRVYNS